MSKSRNIVVGIIIGLLVLAFALWGSEDVLGPQANNTVLKIGDEEVNTREFRRAYDNQMRYLTDVTGQTLTNEEALAANIPGNLVNRFLIEKIFLTDAKDLGVGYNERNAREELEKIEVFQDPFDKTYSFEQAQAILGRQGVSTEEYANQLLSEKRIEQVQPAISRGILTPEEFAEIAYDFRLESRNARVLTLTESSVPAAPEPTDEQLQAYIDENINTFTLPEYRRATMIRMEPTDFRYMDEDALFGIKDIETAKTAFNNIFVSEEEIDQQYEITVISENLGTPATRSLRIFYAENEDTAKAVAEKISDGLSPEEIVSLLGLKTFDEIVDKVQEDIFDVNVAEAAFELQEGDIKTLEGYLGTWVTFQVTGMVEEVKPSKDSIRSDVLNTILEQRRLDVIYDKMGELQEKIEEGRTLEEAADIIGLPYTVLPYLDRNGSTQDEIPMLGTQRLPGVATDNEIMRFIFTSNPGTEVDIFDTARGGTAMIRVDSIIDQTPKSFEASRGLATVLWQEQYVEDAMTELMQSLTDRVYAGESLEDVAASVEYAQITNVTLTREQEEPTIGNLIWAGIIEGKEGDLVQGDGPERFVRQIAILDEIVPNDTPIPPSQRTVELDRITSEISNDIMSAYQTAVIREHPYTQNDAAVRSALGLDSVEP